MALLSVVRRWHFREGMPIREVERRTGLSRNTIRKYLRSGTVEPKFKVPISPAVRSGWPYRCAPAPVHRGILRRAHRFLFDLCLDSERGPRVLHWRDLQAWPNQPAGSHPPDWNDRLAGDARAGGLAQTAWRS